MKLDAMPTMDNVNNQWWKQDTILTVFLQIIEVSARMFTFKLLHFCGTPKSHRFYETSVFIGSRSESQSDFVLQKE